MANIKSQIKRNRQNIVRRQRNKAVRSELKTYTKKFHEALETGDPELAAEAYRVVASHYDRAASKGVIHANNASNHKSKLAKHLNAL